MTVLSRFSGFTQRHPIVRGMLSYAIIWPTSCIIQQTIAGKTWENYDWKRAGRFCLYGALFTAPTLYGWVRLTSVLWPQQTLRSAVTKALIEQVTYGPFALTCFFFGMTLLEGKSLSTAENEVKNKFLPSWKVGVCVWPIVQTINFQYVPEKNRVPFVSVCSMVWCCFLAYMNELQIKKERDRLAQNKTQASQEAL